MFFLQITLQIDWYFLIVEILTNIRGHSATSATPIYTSLCLAAWWNSRIVLVSSLQWKNIKENFPYSRNYQKKFLNVFLACGIIYDDFICFFFLYILGISLKNKALLTQTETYWQGQVSGLCGWYHLLADIQRDSWGYIITLSKQDPL